VIGDGKETNFWIEPWPWINEDDLRHLFSRVYEISLDKDKCQADMIVERVGEKGCFNGRRRWSGAC
jgi:hypothetical protein